MQEERIQVQRTNLFHLSKKTLRNQATIITNPTILFVEEIIESMAIQVPEPQEILAQDVFKPKIDDLPVEG